VYSSQYNYSWPLQNTWAGMVTMVDDTLRNITAALKAQGMWESTLLVMGGDNVSAAHIPLKSDLRFHISGSELCHIHHIDSQASRDDSYTGTTLLL
jgi:arylsulfatase A-like enzyme